MAPIDQSGALMQVNPLQPQHAHGHSVPSIQLSTLIEYVTQRTYHELTVLSELLPRKQDIERKIEIVQFASRTRQLFVRLLALVKWANSASKVEKCAEISDFLDEQARLFVDTADRLAQMAREHLVKARLPSFSLPCAIDVLTTGTYPRLPSCIKDKIVPADPITYSEKRQTLKRLDQLIEHRLVTNELPEQMRYLKISNGKVVFTVKHEFCVTLTLMGDGADIPWRLLDIEVLVEDPETGDGKALVHSMQVNYIHQLVQSRLIDTDRPLHDLYNCLHSFCQSLQLEVLHSQVQRLIGQRLGEHIRVKEYSAGHKLTISYWRNGMRDQSHQEVYKLSIHLDKSDHGKPLQITHHPPIQGSESVKVAQCIKNDYLSLEKLLIHTVQVRSMSKLKGLEREFRCIVSGTCSIQDVPTVLYVPLVEPCMNSEKLAISVDVLMGTYKVSMPNYKASDLAEIQESVNTNRRGLRPYLTKLRLQLGIKRCKKSLQYLPVSCSSTLPIVNMAGHALQKLGKYKLFVCIPDQNDYYLVIDVCEGANKELEYLYYLLHVTATTYDGDSREDLVADAINSYYKAGTLMLMDTFTSTRGPGSKIHDPLEQEVNALYRKRRLISGPEDSFGMMGGGPSLPKKSKMPDYYVADLVHIVALCKDRIPLVNLGNELQKHDIPHQGVQTESDTAGLSLTILDLPEIHGIDEEVLEQLRDALLSCKIMMQKKGTAAHYMMEFMFSSSPLSSTNAKEQGDVFRVYFQYEVKELPKIVENLVNDWKQLAHLYEAALQFATVYKGCDYLQSEIEIKSFNYRRLTLAYGPKKGFTIGIHYIISDKKFHLSFATVGTNTIPNCHTLVAAQLIHQFNIDHSVTTLAQTLIDTWRPMTVIGKLDTFLLLGFASKPSQPTPPFTIVPHTARHIKLTYRNIYCLDIHCLANKTVSIRDGAYSMFDNNTILEGFTPIVALKMFLSKCSDNSIYRHGTTDTRHTGSPSVVMDNMEAFLSQTGVRNPQGSPGSNPHTPASPSTRMAGMMGTPSPSTILGSHGSPNPSLHVPSPGSFIPAPSPLHIGSTGYSGSTGVVEGFPSTIPPVGSSKWAHPSQRFGPVTAGVQVHPHQSWAVSIPTLVTHDSFIKLLAIGPAPIVPQQPGTTAAQHQLLTSAQQSPIATSSLERFLGCVHIMKQIQQQAQQNEQIQLQPVTDPCVLLFKVTVDMMTCTYRVSVNPVTLQSLHLKVLLQPDAMDPWAGNMEVIERFFEKCVVCPPYKVPFVSAFLSLLTIPMVIFKDFVQIMKLQMNPDPSLKWRVHLCMSIPHLHPPIIHAGLHGIISNKEKILLALYLSRNGTMPLTGNEPKSIPVALIYDQNLNVLKCAEEVLQPNQTPSSPIVMSIMQMLTRFHEFHQHNANECNLFPAVKELLTNLTLPI